MNKARILFLCVMSYLSAETQFKLGVENISPSVIRSLQTHVVAVVSNQTGITQQGERTIDILLKKGISIRYLCAPEHGFDGKVLAEKHVTDTFDSKTRLPIISLYKDYKGTIDQRILLECSAIIIDLQDCGMRHYTYISTLYKMLEAAAQHHIQIIVLDRPNPLGLLMEGPLVEDDLHSFISIAPIPLRHGMTMGELARYFARFLLHAQENLTVVPMSGYTRGRNLKKLQAPLSPNIPSLQSCYGYSFLGLLGEIEPFGFGIGIGTPHAFQCIALPVKFGLDPHVWDELRVVLKKCNVDSRWFTYMHPTRDERFAGIKIHIDDINKVSTMKTLLAILAFFERKKINFKFKLFDKAIGTKNVRLFLEQKLSGKKLVHTINQALQNFFTQAQQILLYQPAPKVTLLHL